jgi:hypothetical protein
MPSEGQWKFEVFFLIPAIACQKSTVSFTSNEMQLKTFHAKKIRRGINMLFC